MLHAHTQVIHVCVYVKHALPTHKVLYCFIRLSLYNWEAKIKI